MSSDLLTHHGQFPVVVDLQDVCATFEDQVAQSNILVFGTSSQVLTADPQDNEEDTIPVTILRISTTLKMTLMTVSFKTEGKRKISIQMRLGETLIILIIPQSFGVFPPQAWKNACTSNTLKATLIHSMTRNVS